LTLDAIMPETYEAPLRAQVEQRIGRNLLRYQLVEARLKAVLPLRQINLSTKGLDDIARAFDGQKRWSLGQLLPGFQEAFETYSADAQHQFEDQLSAFLDARNRLVHHLLQEHAFLTTPEACAACIDRLDKEYGLAEDVARQVLDLQQLVVGSLQLFLESWTTTDSGPSAMAALARRHAERLTERYGNEVQVEFQIPVFDAIQEILESLERTQVRQDGWTIFHNVGVEFQRRYQTLPRGVLALAKQLEHYEFAERIVRDGAGLAWMFRRRTHPC
jgi:hypothetical protein